MNGPTLPEDFWTRLDEKFEILFKKVDGISDKVSHIDAHGCAQRENDKRRIDSLEAWRDKGIIGIVTLLVAVVMQFFGVKYK